MARGNRVLLTDKFIKACQVPEGREQIVVFDQLVSGLVLRVWRSGRRSFYVLHRTGPKKLTWTQVRDPQLPSPNYGEGMTLHNARELAKKLLTRASTGRDIASEAQLARERTFAALTTEYIEKYAMVKKKSWRADALDIRTQLAPHWDHRPVASIRRSEVRSLLDAIVARGAPTRANRTLSLISKMFNVALDREWVDFNPAAKMAKPANEGRRSRLLNHGEIRAFWQWLERPAPEGDDVQRWRLNRALLKLRLMTAARGNEILGTRWQDIDWETAWWTMPVTKNGREHKLPLSPSALSVFRDLKQYRTSTDDAAYVFAGILGKRQRRKVLVGLPFKNFLPRDLRRTATTEIREMGGVPRDVVSIILNHADPSITARYDLSEQRVLLCQALDGWATRLHRIVNGLRLVDSAGAKAARPKAAAGKRGGRKAS